MSTVSKIKHLYAHENGDTITPRMGLQIETGFGLHQYYDPNTGEVTQTNFADHPAVLFPQAWSSALAKIVVPSTTGQQWYYNNISDNAGILDENGAVKTAYASLFETTSVVINGSTFPALKIKGNLVSAEEDDYTDKYIFYVGTYNGMQFTCSQMIPVQASVGDAYSVLVSVTGADGSGDETLSNDNDWIQYTAFLQLAGTSIADASFEWQHLVDGEWVTVTNNAGLTEISANTLKLYDAAIEGTEIFRVCVVYNGKTYYKTMQPSDIHDPYFIDDGCSIAGDSVKQGETASFSPKVYKRDTGEDVTTSEGWTFEFVILSRTDGSVITDLTVSSLTYDKIKEKGGVAVRIKASR